MGNFTATHAITVLVCKLQTTSLEARLTDCKLPSLESGLETNNKPELQENKVTLVLHGKVLSVQHQPRVTTSTVCLLK